MYRDVLLDRVLFLALSALNMVYNFRSQCLSQSETGSESVLNNRCR